MNQFVKALRGCLNEKDVENNWRKEISKDCKTDIISPYTTDGYFKLNDHAVLCEFKYSRSLKKREEMIRILIQLLFYLKKFADHPDEQIFPSLLFFGDENECSLIPTDLVVSYLRGPYDWNLAPSEAGVKEQNLFNDLFNNQNISPPIWDITDDFTIRKNLSPYFIRILSQKKAEITITPNNLVAVYNYWLDNVIKDKNVSNEDNVDIFMKLLINPNDVILHPKKSDILVCIGSGKEVKVNTHGFQTFFSMYKEQHTIEQLAELAAAKDRLLLEKHRRRTGAFFTPKIWVDEAHKMMDRNLGADWREKYVVWDASAGTANLTRDYRFKELYLSTLEQTDVDIIKQSGFNPEATVFQFDFLNDGLEKLPKGLKDALKENKPIVFLNNPPYGTSSDFKYSSSGDTKESIGTSIVSKQMGHDKLGNSGRDMCNQFLYHIHNIIKNNNLTNSFSGLYSKKGLYTIDGYCQFRSKVFKPMVCIDSFIFSGSAFDGVSSWEIMFSLMKGRTNGI